MIQPRENNRQRKQKGEQMEKKACFTMIIIITLKMFEANERVR